RARPRRWVDSALEPASRRRAVSVALPTQPPGVPPGRLSTARTWRPSKRRWVEASFTPANALGVDPVGGFPPPAGGVEPPAGWATNSSLTMSVFPTERPEPSTALA